MTMDTSQINRLLTEIYGSKYARRFGEGFRALVAEYARERPGSPDVSCRSRSWLIAYPDHLVDGGTSPLAILAEFLDTRLRPHITGIHVLPCFPSSSDEGFSVMDYTAIDSRHGTWKDVERLGSAGDLMLDAVINHASVQGTWFERWRAGDRRYADYFRTEEPDANLSGVVRAREHPLLTRFDTAMGERWVWTTFSADQADLDYRNPAVLLDVCHVLLTYAAHGASAIRLDAVGFLWKQAGTPSIHREETHKIIQLMRAVLDATYPDVRLVSETNVPHDENIQYLGDGTVREADMVYQFPLPPLTLHAFWKGDGAVLKAWLSTGDDIPPGTTYLNFLASHDGVGLRPLEGLVDRADVDALVETCRHNGGLVTYRSGAEGVPVAYELNATWFDLIRGSDEGELAMARHIASHALMLALEGEPAIYLQALFAEPNSIELAEASDLARSINRHKFHIADVDRCLDDAASAAARSLSTLLTMLDWRASTAAFDPGSTQTVVDTPDTVIGIERRGSDDSVARVFVNLTNTNVVVANDLDAQVHGLGATASATSIELDPFGVAWVIPSDTLHA
jgi:sucrose phosphorylase